MTDEAPPPKGRIWLRRLLKFVGLLGLVTLLTIFVWLSGALYHRFIRFPREESAWQNLRAQRQPVTERTSWIEYRGILHTHSRYSHDSAMPTEEILQVLQQTGIDFICL